MQSVCQSAHVSLLPGTEKPKGKAVPSYTVYSRKVELAMSLIRRVRLDTRDQLGASCVDTYRAKAMST